MEAYQQRVVDEKTALDENLDRLSTFIESPKFSDVNGAEQSLLQKQQTLMAEYSGVLGERIALF